MHGKKKVSVSENERFIALSSSIHEDIVCAGSLTFVPRSLQLKDSAKY
jgi:hypothetical protein